MDPNPNRAEAERLLEMAGKLLEGRDLTGAREFATLAQETDPLIDGSDQILAVAEVLLASEKRVNGYYDWYGVLQIAGGSDDQELIKQQYRRLAILLRPDKNRSPYADQAFQLVNEAWAVLSNPDQKTVYDRELRVFSKVDLPESNSGQPAGKKLPVKRGRPPAAPREAALDRGEKLSSFWTGCPYCCRLYEYPRLYEDCCMRCQSCQRAFQAVRLPSLPPLIPGKDAYLCPWGGLPFVAMLGTGGTSEGFPLWPPPQPPLPFPGYGQQTVNPPPPAPTPPMVVVGPAGGNVGGVVPAGEVARESVAQRKRGRPRKNPV
ncbi:uncharacterized protein LOC116215818 [Punica granatum]|uniref:Uncharacterized protein LOC116215818 n=2 Tax=Punica granatum TaxID=22663 RepID=A0A6P8ENI7_PUNGR|nr:uncharacterized protein LOC116215818 [Punica granatum]XP_031407462.1 uncharacterized protein LOC116215818 [Punica granatum]XP_031407471.1 uncharacterized protein LOC116215818 [Punica granatum]XP_031407480.1 uncharacterized protein LOC116215818 [Punica granatum]XP_031407488.1 uncharacterized protein LOC116215818 [Punica granatum]XP_031407496.1 uncharacterized protein LOC116215818 [Punica granatum]XP_031407504.1 uncharacterized protein LOC116215818 [Punica granatum]XP_031407513.1 uncharacte